MKVVAECKMQGVDSRPGFKDPSKRVYCVAFYQGVDSLRCYCTPDQYVSCSQIASGTDIAVTLNLNVTNNRVELVDVVPVAKNAATAKN